MTRVVLRLLLVAIPPATSQPSPLACGGRVWSPPPDLISGVPGRLVRRPTARVPYWYLMLWTILIVLVIIILALVAWRLFTGRRV